MTAIRAYERVYDVGTAHASGTGAALTRNPAPWSARTSTKEGQRA